MKRGIKKKMRTDGELSRNAKRIYNPESPASSFRNYGMVRASYALKQDKAWGYPSKVLIEPTNTCNLKCPLCPTGIDDLNRPKGLMELDHFRRIIDEIRNYTTELEVAGYGEPFINKNINEMLTYAVKAGLYDHMHSNTILIDTPEKVEGLIASGLHRLTTSIDGSTQEVYEKYRVGGDLGVALNNLKAIVDEKRKQGALNPSIECQVVITKQNEHQVEEIRQIAEEIGVDRFRGKTANLTLAREEGDAGIDPKMVQRYFPNTGIFRRYSVNDQGQTMQNGCAWLYKRAFIMWNGDVTTCCYDPRGINNMGNVFEAGSFDAVWNGRRFQKLRKTVNSDITKAKPLCSICPDRVCVSRKTTNGN